MMMYRCAKCKEVFPKTDILVESWREYRGECWGSPAYETVSEDHCPNCNSVDIDEYWEDEDEDNSED